MEQKAKLFGWVLGFSHKTILICDKESNKDTFNEFEWKLRCHGFKLELSLRGYVYECECLSEQEAETKKQELIDFVKGIKPEFVTVFLEDITDFIRHRNDVRERILDMEGIIDTKQPAKV